MRLFIGVKASPALQDKIREWQLRWQYLLTSPKLHRGGTARFMRADDLHVTLVPPWECDSAEGFISSLESLREPSFDISFHTISLGPQKFQPRLFWAEGTESTRLENLKKHVEQSVGAVPEARKFFPHITLARFNNEAAETIQKEFADEEVFWKERVDNVTLFKSHQNIEGTWYEVIKQIPLT
jgi:2'-5' RNA ligase